MKQTKRRSRPALSLSRLTLHRLRVGQWKVAAVTSGAGLAAVRSYLRTVDATRYAILVVERRQR
jgi:hypothetical protein